MLRTLHSLNIFRFQKCIDCLDRGSIKSLVKVKNLFTINLKTTPFTESGECKDEIEFVFDDGKRLYVSENFLNYVSQVLKAMFEHDFKEKENRRVTMTGKKYEDVLEFLLCLHPNVQKPVTSK